jgi:acyl dehydratase
VCEVPLSASDPATLTAAAADDGWFEDFVPGAVVEFGDIEVSAADIIDFASRFDPQPMHLDPAERKQ